MGERGLRIGVCEPPYKQFGGTLGAESDLAHTVATVRQDGVIFDPRVGPASSFSPSGVLFRQ